MRALCELLEAATAANDLATARQHAEALPALFAETAALLRAELLAAARAS
jgi:hypothetical protein